MKTKEPIQKIKIKKISENKIIDNILKYEKEKNHELMKLFNRKPQRVHQIYTKNAVLIHEDEEKYTDFFSKMNRYNKIHDKNLSKYNQKKNENKNFIKQYTGYKLYNSKICKDDQNTLYGDILPLYNQKKFFFSDKFLSGKKIFQQSGLLIQSQRHLNEYYKRVEKRIFNKGLRDIAFINHLNMFIDDKIQKNKMKELEKEYQLLEKYGKVKKESVSAKLEKYKRTKKYKLRKRLEAMKALDLFVQNEKDIEKEKKYIEKITKLIETEEKERQIELDKSQNNKENNLENENNNSLFILNRYANNKYNNKINASNILPKNKSSTNIHSTLYKDTINSTNNNYETKQTMINTNQPIRINKRNSINSNPDFSEISLENNIIDTYENKDKTDYININDISNKDNPINIFPKIKKQNQHSNNSSTVRFNMRNKLKEIMTLTKFDKNENLSTITIFNKTDNTSSVKKTGRNNHNISIRNFKMTHYTTKFNENPKEKRNKINNLVTQNYNSSMDDLTKGDIKWSLYKDFNNLNKNIYFRNNHKFHRFCENNTTIPKNITDKVSKSFEYDEEIKQAHVDYVKLLMNQKISKYYDKNLV